ncbi:MAG: tyrosine-type recombinase/integrase [Rhodopseudomonas sp.]|nr:tyrosine-type recombinase/integrase [Rhodopseudomonas sp.]
MAGPDQQVCVEGPAVTKDFRYLVRDKDRHGRPRFLVRMPVGGSRRKITITAPYGTPEFARAYLDAVETLVSGGPRTGAGKARIERAAPATLGWLAAQYFGSVEFQNLDRTSQRTRRAVIEQCLREPLKPGSKLTMAQVPYLRIDANHMLLIRDRRRDKPGAANNRLKYMSAMFGWAIERAVYKLGANPCRDVKAIRYASSGYYTWTIADVRQYVERHPVGTMAYLAFALMLFLGARRGDAIRLGPRNVRDGTMAYVPRKTAHIRPEESVKPILRPLADAISQTLGTGLRTFLMTGHGQPFTDAGFGNKMREWCDQAGLPECSAHGLKKIAATICAEMGATDRQMMALFDWHSEKMVKKYTGAARNRLLAAEAAKLLGSLSWAPIENKAEAG